MHHRLETNRNDDNVLDDLINLSLIDNISTTQQMLLLQTPNARCIGYLVAVKLRNGTHREKTSPKKKQSRSIISPKKKTFYRPITHPKKRPPKKPPKQTILLPPRRHNLIPPPPPPHMENGRLHRPHPHPLAPPPLLQRQLLVEAEDAPFLGRAVHVAGAAAARGVVFLRRRRGEGGVVGWEGG